MSGAVTGCVCDAAVDVHRVTVCYALFADARPVGAYAYSLPLAWQEPRFVRAYFRKAHHGFPIASSRLPYCVITASLLRHHGLLVASSRQVDGTIFGAHEWSSSSVPARVHPLP